MTQREERPIGAYAVLMALFAAGVGGAFGAAARSRRLPERIGARDLILLGIATHKLSRIVTKDRVTRTLRVPFTEVQGKGGPGELEERARGDGMRRAVGELLVCPYCIAAWIAGAFVSSLLFLPRTTRAVAGIFTLVAASDFLQLGYKALERRASNGS